MWDHWQKGDSLQQIAQLFDRNHSSIQRILAETGGIRPAVRRRSRLTLTLAEREEISRAVVAGNSVRSIAALLGRAASTVSREIRRNGGQGCYRANQADQAAWDRAHRPKVCKLVENRAVAQIVADKLQLQWSPEQIAGWLKRSYPDDTSYQATVKDRAVPGHWEGDLLCGSRNSQIATLVERHTRYVMLVKLVGKDSETVISALIENARDLPQELYKSLTWDRGKEMADHKRFTVATDIKVYFCDPHRLWQRGSNENTNGLLRQYFPKGTDLADHSQATLNEVARQLNNRPRKTLNYETPAERFSQSVASTG
ncbi:IS30 family transposase [Pseudomonas sp. FP2196]|uniref:IS30 family transposase n=1 Tax=Pseudomonas sp. FP2196 TaxID=2954086 RepID=UPI0027322BFD|nr:IS30 family transposase [Pseudomonas sp. FP2196]WLH33264.1 IS30 family transposase [Pseudomonas sp. FP2196]